MCYFRTFKSFQKLIFLNFWNDLEKNLKKNLLLLKIVQLKNLRLIFLIRKNDMLLKRTIQYREETKFQAVSF